jgi:hypothetical protein
MTTLIPYVPARSAYNRSLTPAFTWQQQRPVVPLRTNRFGRQGISSEWKYLFDIQKNILASYSQTCSFRLPPEMEFCMLVTQWKYDTIWDSSVTQKVLHPSYQQIIGMGPIAVPWILKELRQEPDFWFDALTAITREQPVLVEHAGDMQAMTDDWLEWGRLNGYEC